MTMRRHYDQVGTYIVGVRDDLPGQESGARKSSAPDDGGDSFTRYAIELNLCFPLPERERLQRLGRHLGRVCRYLNDVYETKRSFVLHGNLAGYLEGAHGVVVEIDRAQNLSKSVGHNILSSPAVHASVHAGALGLSVLALGDDEPVATRGPTWVSGFAALARPSVFTSSSICARYVVYFGAFRAV